MKIDLTTFAILSRCLIDKLDPEGKHSPLSNNVSAILMDSKALEARQWNEEVKKFRAARALQRKVFGLSRIAHKKKVERFFGLRASRTKRK